MKKKERGVQRIKMEIIPNLLPVPSPILDQFAHAEKGEEKKKLEKKRGGRDQPCRIPLHFLSIHRPYLRPSPRVCPANVGQTGG